jgi:hypothetical protein
MGARYTVTKTATAVAAAFDSLTITAPAGRSLKIWAIRTFSAAVAAAACEILVSRSTAGTTPVAIIPTPVNADSAAATFTAAGSWTTTPTIGVTISRINMTAAGAIDSRVFPPGMEIDVPGGGQISFRAATGTNAVGFEVLVEQV